MNEQLSALLHDEARAIDVPPPATADVLALGRRGRRRRRGAVAASAAAVVTAIGGGAVLVTSPPEQTEEVSFAVDPYREQGALAVDDELYVAGRRVPFERAVKSFYYTADGVVVRSGTSPWTDDGDTDHYTLVTQSGSRTELDLTTKDRMIATEPDSSRLAYAEPAADGRWAVVVTDVGTGEELSRTVIDGRFTWGGWEAPPVALDGDLVWVHLDGGWTEVDWRSGAVREVPGTGTVDEIANGRYATVEDGRWTIRSMADSAPLAVIDVGKDAFGMLSPDGRFVRFLDWAMPGEKGMEPFIYDVDNERRAALPPGRELGWTPEGDVLSLGRDGGVSTCEVGGGCQASGITVEVTQESVIKLGGNSYES